MVDRWGNLHSVGRRFAQVCSWSIPSVCAHTELLLGIRGVLGVNPETESESDINRFPHKATESAWRECGVGRGSVAVCEVFQIIILIVRMKKPG